MFRLEKVFQNDDSGYYLFISFFKTVILIISIYIFSVLAKNTIYDFLKFEIYKNSKYFLYSIFFSLLFFLFTLSGKKKEYKQNLFSFVKYDITNFIITNTILLSLLN